jgi:hypothetical protein
LGDCAGSGSTCIGHLLRSVEGWRVFDADNGEIEAYATKEAAVEALMRLEPVEG